MSTFLITPSSLYYPIAAATGAILTLAMTESQVLSQISLAFEPYVRSPSDLRAIRTRISRYIETLQPYQDVASSDADKFVIPDNVTGTRHRYLKAVHANILAKQKYTRQRDKIHGRNLGSDVASGPDEVVSSHLELLKLRRQHQQYRVLSKYASDAERLAGQNHILEPQLLNEKCLNGQHKDFSLLYASNSSAEVQELSRRLEIAILQADYQLKQEIQLLEEVKSGQLATSSSNSAAKLHALEVTRGELTRWIEESLSECDLNERRTIGRDTSESRENIETIDHGQKISEQYEQYIEARKWLLTATTTFSSRLLETDPTNLFKTREPSHHGQSLAVNTNTRQLPKSQSKFESEAQLKEESYVALPYLMATHLPLHLLNSALSQSQSCLSSRLTKNTQDLTEQLYRLSDESHLLPSYPILAKTKSKTKTDLPGSAKGELDEAEKLLEAWQFAMHAASTATEATAEKQIREGGVSVDQVLTLVKRHKERVEMWDGMD